jgi:hypothetical protein
MQVYFGVDGVVTASQSGQNFLGHMRPSQLQFIAGAEQRFIGRGQQTFLEHFDLIESRKPRLRRGLRRLGRGWSCPQAPDFAHGGTKEFLVGIVGSAHVADLP